MSDRRLLSRRVKNYWAYCSSRSAMFAAITTQILLLQLRHPDLVLPIDVFPFRVLLGVAQALSSSRLKSSVCFRSNSK